MYLLFRLPYFSLEEKRVYLRKNSKIYFSDPFILNCLKTKVEGFSQNAFSQSQEFVSKTENRPVLIENMVGKKENTLILRSNIKERLTKLKCFWDIFGKSSQLLTKLYRTMSS